MNIFYSRVFVNNEYFLFIRNYVELKLPPQKFFYGRLNRRAALLIFVGSAEIKFYFTNPTPFRLNGVHFCSKLIVKW